MRRTLRLAWTTLLICACAVVLAPFSYRVEAAEIAPTGDVSCTYGVNKSTGTFNFDATVQVGYRCFANPAGSGWSAVLGALDGTSGTHRFRYIHRFDSIADACASPVTISSFVEVGDASVTWTIVHGDMRLADGTLVKAANTPFLPVNYFHVLWRAMPSAGIYHCFDQRPTLGVRQVSNSAINALAQAVSSYATYPSSDFPSTGFGSTTWWEEHPDHYSNGAGGFAPSDFCVDSDITITVNGTTVNGTTSAFVQDGDDIAVEVGDWFDGTEREWSYRWFSGAPSHTPFPLTLDGTFDFSDTLPSTTSAADVVNLQVRCVDATGDYYWSPESGGNVVACGLAGGTSENGWCSVQWEGGDLCTSITFLWGDLVDLEVEAGDTFELPYVFPAGTYAQDVESLEANWLKVVTTYAVAVDVLDIGGASIVDGDALIPRDTTARQGVVVFEVVDPLPGSVTSIVIGDDIDTIRCDGRVSMPGPSIAGLVGSIVDDDDPASIAACLNGNRPGLNPSSWVPALVGMQVCTFRYLVIPPGEDLEAWVIDARDAMEQTPPFSFAILLVDFGDGIVDAFNDPSGSGCFDVAIPAAGTPAGDVCVGDGIALSGGQRNLIALIIAVPLYLGLIGHGFGLLRR